MSFKYKFFIGCLLFSPVSLVSGQTFLGQNGGGVKTAIPFVAISPDAKASSMGEAGAASTPDVYSMHWNPSKLTFAENRTGIAFSYTPWLRQLVPDINLTSFSGYTQVDSSQAVGISVKYFSSGEMDPMGRRLIRNSLNEYAGDISYSRKFSKNFSGGLTLRYLYSDNLGGNLPASITSGYSSDASLYYQKDFYPSIGKTVFSVGANLSNMGPRMFYYSTIKKSFLPTNLRIGVGVKREIDRNHAFAIIIDFNKQLVAGKNGDVSKDLASISSSLGGEYIFRDIVAFRFGYFYESIPYGGRQFATYGMGLKCKKLSLDLSYLDSTRNQNSPLQNTIHFSLAYIL